MSKADLLSKAFHNEERAQACSSPLQNLALNIVERWLSDALVLDESMIIQANENQSAAFMISTTEGECKV